MIWRKRKNPADSSAQHLANLLGASVAGFIPETKNGKPPIVNLSTELFMRNNVSIAELVVLSCLIKGGDENRSVVLHEFQPEFLPVKSFERYLCTIILTQLQTNGIVSIAEIELKIEDFGIKVWGEPLKNKEKRGYLFRWNQILTFEPTVSQAERAIILCRNNAKKNGWI